MFDILKIFSKGKKQKKERVTKDCWEIIDDLPRWIDKKRLEKEMHVEDIPGLVYTKYIKGKTFIYRCQIYSGNAGFQGQGCISPEEITYSRKLRIGK